ncbi:hypothetical protein ACG873_31310 [Mesorhizobium sp. AaZ16]
MMQKAQEYVLIDLTAPLTVDHLAHKIAMSTRTFARVFSVPRRPSS